MRPNDERRAGVVGTTGVEGPGDARRACRVVPARSRCLCPPLLCVRSVKNGGIPGASYGNASVGPSTRPVNRVQLLLTGGERVSDEHARNVYHACRPGSCRQSCKEAADQLCCGLRRPQRGIRARLRYTNFLATMLHSASGS